MITPKIRVVRARTVYRGSQIHMAFLSELAHKMATGQITLRMLDLRGLEHALVSGLKGRDTMREKLTRTGAELICDEENLIIENKRYWNGYCDKEDLSRELSQMVMDPLI